MSTSVAAGAGGHGVTTGIVAHDAKVVDRRQANSLLVNEGFMLDLGGCSGRDGGVLLLDSGDGLCGYGDVLDVLNATFVDRPPRQEAEDQRQNPGVQVSFE